MLSLHTNAASLSTQNSLGATNKALSSSMTKLGTGFRVNSAMDDAAGLQIATRLNAQSRGMQVAQKNTQNGISMLQTAEGALSEVSSILIRMKDLATEAATASSSADDRTALQAEYDALGLEMQNIMSNTAFGGAKLFTNGGLADREKLTFQIGATSDEKLEFDGKTALGTVSDELLKVSTKYTLKPSGATGTAITDPELKLATDDQGAKARGMIDTLTDTINAVASFRSSLGAVANRLEHTYSNLSNMIQNTEAAKGRIMDVDYASETSNMTSKQMLMQASTSMLKQSNSMSQMVASLLQ